MEANTCNLQEGEGVFEEVSKFEEKCKKVGSFTNIYEPISVLDTRRSPSPSTSTSTLSSSFGGGGNVGGGGNNGAGGGCATDINPTSLVVISDNILNQKLPVSVLPASEDEPDGCRKDEWASELQPISGVSAGSSQRFSLGVGLDDWESLLTESASLDQSLLRLVSHDVDDASGNLKQLLVGNFNDTGEISAWSPSGHAISSLNPSLAVSSSGFCFNQNNNGKISSALASNSCVLNNNFNNSQNPTLPLPQPHQFAPQMILNQQQNFQSATNLDMSAALLLCNNISQQEQNHFEPQLKRHNSGISSCNTQISKVPCSDSGHENLFSKQHPHVGVENQLNLLLPYQLQQKPFIVPKQEVAGCEERFSYLRHHQQQQFIYDELYKAAELVLDGNFSHAQVILARLNHQLSGNTKPFERAAFYFKEALLMSLAVNSIPRIPTPVDGMFKMGAYKVLSEVSPLVQFMNFTSNQAILEAIGDADSIHILDFDIGFGAQWSSFLQELPGRDRKPPSLKITAFASPTTHHSIELGLMHENLTQFANELGVSFQLEVVNFDSFDPSTYLIPPSGSLENEAIAVNFPIWSLANHLPALPSLLRFIKQLSPKIMVSMDRGCDMIELPFPQHILHGLQYYDILFDSIDAANAASDSVTKIERFLFQPRIDDMVLGRLHFPEQMLSWKSVFASMGFSSVPFSNFAESQAECVVRRTQDRGFFVEKRQASLVLRWKHRDLMSASAWRC